MKDIAHLEDGRTIVKLLGDVCIVKQLEQDKMSGGIVLPQTADPLKIGIRAEVIQIGAKFRYAAEFNAHTKYSREGVAPLIVMVSKFLGTQIDKFNERIRVYDGEDILAIVTMNE